MIKYDEIEIHWYAITDFTIGNSCIPVERAMEIFKTYNLKTVKYSVLGTFSTFIELNKELLNRFNLVSESSIEDENEGSVLYFETSPIVNQ